MTGYNMPPGVDPGDIPGNRATDAALDDLYPWIDAAILAGVDPETIAEMARDALERYIRANEPD